MRIALLCSFRGHWSSFPFEMPKVDAACSCWSCAFAKVRAAYPQSRLRSHTGRINAASMEPQNGFWRGRKFSRRPVSRILSRTIIPLGGALLRSLIATYPRVVAHRAGTHVSACAAKFPAYLVLLRVGFTMPPTLQPERCALTAPFHPYPALASAAVSSLWHLPSRSLDAPVPDVIRHTALRSSDFPPPASLAANRQRSPSRLP